MDLCISVPQNAPEGVVYSLPADFTAEGEKRGGCLCAHLRKRRACAGVPDKRLHRI